MPIYVYGCDCGHRFEERRAVDDRNVPVKCGECGYPAPRHFEPTVNIQTPESFRHTASDFLPPKGDSAWEGMSRESSQTHAKPVRTLKEFVESGGG